MYMCIFCNKMILFPTREYARVVDDVYCSELCFSKCYKNISIEDNSFEQNWLLD